MIYDVALQKLINLYLAIGMGLLAMALMILTYIEIWRPRRLIAPRSKGLSGVLRWWFYSIPWVATLTIVGLTAFSLAYSIYRMIYPANW